MQRCQAALVLVQPARQLLDRMLGVVLQAHHGDPAPTISYTHQEGVTMRTTATAAAMAAAASIVRLRRTCLVLVGISTAGLVIGERMAEVASWIRLLPVMQA